MSARYCSTRSRCATACCPGWRLPFECGRHAGERACLHPTHRPTLRICARSRPPRCSLQYVHAPAPPRTLPDTGGLVVTDDGRRVLVFDRCTGALTVLAFVFG